MKITKKLSLAIETAVEAGSLALFGDGKLLDQRTGRADAGISRSENVLLDIKEILKDNRVAAAEIKAIYVSSGPGSYTGARIGAAVAHGLSRAVGCDLIACQVLEAMVAHGFNTVKKQFAIETGIIDEKSAKQIKTFENNYISFIAAIPFGKKQICLQRCLLDWNGKIKSAENPVAVNRNESAEFLKHENIRIVVHDSLYLELLGASRTYNFTYSRLINAGTNLAIILQEYQGVRRIVDANVHQKWQSISPIYVSGA